MASEAIAMLGVSVTIPELGTLLRSARVAGVLASQLYSFIITKLSNAQRVGTICSHL